MYECMTFCLKEKAKISQTSDKTENHKSYSTDRGKTSHIARRCRFIEELMAVFLLARNAINCASSHATLMAVLISLFYCSE